MNALDEKNSIHTDHEEDARGEENVEADEREGNGDFVK